jgi:glycosyltransferase involved in cell wall biosynthesis
VDGFLIPVKDDNKMAEAIETLLGNGEKAGELSRNARKKAHKFDGSIVKTDWNEILN